MRSMRSTNALPRSADYAAENLTEQPNVVAQGFVEV
jgi:hypothetical protein